MPSSWPGKLLMRRLGSVGCGESCGPPKNQGWKKKKVGETHHFEELCVFFFFFGGKRCVPSFLEVAYNVIEMSGQTYLGQVFVPMKKAFSKLKEKQRVKQICIAGEGVNGV